MNEHVETKNIRRSGELWQVGEMSAMYVVFCDGIGSYASDLFGPLPFAPNKGEVLYIEAKGLPEGFVFKKGLNIVPVEKNIHWVGSSYEWSFENDQPTESFLNRTNQLLRNWLKVPFKIIEHCAAVRPATLERRPFVGMHPEMHYSGISDIYTALYFLLHHQDQQGGYV